MSSFICRQSVRYGARAAALLAATALVSAGVVPTAAAHVTVSSPDAKPGGWAKLVFRVPTESDTARTTRLTVTLPKDHPFAHVGVQVKAGWTVTRTEQKLATAIESGDSTVSKAVSTVTWTTAGGGIGSHEFDEFALSVGKLPTGVGTLSFPADQTYSDGKVVRWHEPRAGSAEPEHPAPVLQLATDAQPDTPRAESGGSDVVARSLGGVAVLIGLAGLVAGLRRRPAGQQRP